MNIHDEQLDFPGAAELAEAGRVDPPGADVVAAARSALREAVRQDTGPRPAESPAAGRRRPARRRKILLAAGAVAAATAAAVVLPVVALDGGAPPADASAAGFLNSMADQAAAEGSGAAAYWKIQTKHVRYDGSREEQSVVLSPTHVGAKPLRMTWNVGEGEVDWAGLAGLPTDPAALRAALAEGAEGARAERQVRDQVEHLLTFSPAPAELRAALYQVLADSPGLELAGPAQDSEGRTGMKILFKTPTYGNLPPAQTQWIVDEENGQVLETAEIAEEDFPGQKDCEPSAGADTECLPAYEAGDVIDRETYLFNGPVPAPDRTGTD
ncbi:hypothetical protein DMB38_31645 [Streptomyces sp. WAC 06738]|uniref:hypothetical protein n=1 Tax=Streptomyces sp. WAC 06738 TaxID=2203210 RepID=UPI000F6D0A54|nr:hypothetical protein [Streptomyces sp. WAC 06738]AZM49727.1 hypothetical protein DMB38_31645 [Streptomyces sp. WAC 06738]